MHARTSFLITNGGPHTPEKWAECTASQFINIGETASGEALAGARRLEIAFIDILEKHHTVVQNGERGALVGNPDRLLTDMNPSEHLDGDTDTVMREIVAAAQGTAFAEHFNKLDVQTYITNVLNEHFATNAHIERSWHADRFPNLPQALAYRAAVHPGA